MSKNEGQRWRPWMSPRLGGGREGGRDKYVKKRSTKKNRSRDFPVVRW